MQNSQLMQNSIVTPAASVLAQSKNLMPVPEACQRTLRSGLPQNICIFILDIVAYFRQDTFVACLGRMG